MARLCARKISIAASDWASAATKLVIAVCRLASYRPVPSGAPLPSPALTTTRSMRAEVRREASRKTAKTCVVVVDVERADLDPAIGVRRGDLGAQRLEACRRAARTARGRGRGRRTGGPSRRRARELAPVIRIRRRRGVPSMPGDSNVRVMAGRWYKEAVIYCVEVDSFQDSDGDGCGDLRGLDQPAGLPRPARRDLPVAQPDPSRPAARQRLRRQRLLRHRPAARQPRRLRRARPAGRANAASGSCSTWWSTTPPTSTRGSSLGPQRPGLAVPRLVRVERRPSRPTAGRASSSRASRPRPGPSTDAGQALVLPPLLRLPARPELGQPGGPGRDRAR